MIDKADVIVFPRDKATKIFPDLKISCRTCLFAKEIIEKPCEDPTANELLLMLHDFAKKHKLKEKPYVVKCAYWLDARGMKYCVMVNDPKPNELKHHDIRKCYVPKVRVNKTELGNIMRRCEEDGKMG